MHACKRTRLKELDRGKIIRHFVEYWADRLAAEVNELAWATAVNELSRLGMQSRVPTHHGPHHDAVKSTTTCVGVYDGVGVSALLTVATWRPLGKCPTHRRAAPSGRPAEVLLPFRHCFNVGDAHGELGSEMERRFACLTAETSLCHTSWHRW